MRLMRLEGSLAGRVWPQTRLIWRRIRARTLLPYVPFPFSPLTPSASPYDIGYHCKAFYVPNASRPNLTVLCSAYAHRIVTEGGQDVTATGVEFTHSDTQRGQMYVVHAGKEVLVCAGYVFPWLRLGPTFRSV